MNVFLLLYENVSQIMAKYFTTVHHGGVLKVMMLDYSFNLKCSTFSYVVHRREFSPDSWTLHGGSGPDHCEWQCCKFWRCPRTDVRNVLLPQHHLSSRTGGNSGILTAVRLEVQLF